MKGRVILGVALGALFLYLSFRNVEFHDIGRIIRGAHYRHVLLFLALNFLVLWIRALRWRFLLHPVHRLPAHRLLSPMSIGFMVNLLLPARAGEFVRAYLLGKKEGISKSAAFATVVVERLFDGLAISSFMGLAPFFLPLEARSRAGIVIWAGLSFFLLYLGTLVFLLALSHHRLRMEGFFARSPLPQRWPLLGRVFGLVQKFTDGLAILRSRGEAAAALAFSFFIWSALGLGNYLMMSAIDLHLPFYASYFLLVAQSFGVMVPTPGYVGSYQYAHIVGLSVYDVSEPVALSVAILIHAGFFFTFVSAGIFFLLRDHVSLGELKQASTE